MSKNRFQVTLVPERSQEHTFCHPLEVIPLIHVEKEIPSPPPLPATFTSVNETNKPSTRLFNTFLQRLKPHSASTDIIPTLEPHLVSIPHATSTNNLGVTSEIDKTDSCYSTIHSNIFDTNSLRLTNKFLHELRLKRRELHEKANNLSIDQRIALHRQENDREILRAQDIFDIHFELNDNDNLPLDIFNEDAQEKIRTNIFNELDRQRMKKYHKQHRQLVLGRALLMFITSLLLLMGITLIYVVIDLYDRANYADANFSENDFISIVNDTPLDFQ